MNKPVTLADIAERLGLSVSAVSLAMRNKPGLPAETRQRILTVAAELGYRPKAPKPRARNGAGCMQSLAAIIKYDHGVTPQANPFYSHVLVGIEQACRQRQINLLFASLPVDGDNNPTDTPRVLLESHADGLLLVGAFVTPRLAALLEQQNVPVVLVDGYAEAARYDSVVSDNMGGADAMVAHLIRCGHRHIAYAGSLATQFPSLRERRDGYLRALGEHGLAPYCLDLGNDPSASAPAQTAAFLHQHPQVTAFFGGNDGAAIAVAQAVQRMGLRIPHDVSVAGFDDIDEARTTTPALTTMAVDKVAMGGNAVALLLNRAESPDSARVSLVLHPTLVERQSVAAAPATEGLRRTE